MAHDSALRRRRVELGITQTELAGSAGVSRQLVAAVEAGVNTPAVDAALRLAQVLGCSAEDLFATAPRRPRIAPAARPPTTLDTGVLVVAGCDPALAIAEAMVAGERPARLLALDATTGTALRSLRDGGVHAAVAHGRVEHLPQPPVDVIRLQLARWHVGLGLAPGLKARTLAACLEHRVLIVQRQESAASQQALRRAVNALGYELPSGAVASGHLDAARAAVTIGCAAITTEGAALMSGLRFVPLELHTVEIWLDRRWEHHPTFHTLGNLLTSSAFAAKVSHMGGYDLTGCGTVLPAMTASLTGS
jgi:transcriptional regulator with XRE-family HTH domain